MNVIETSYRLYWQSKEDAYVGQSGHTWLNLKAGSPQSLMQLGWIRGRIACFRYPKERLGDSQTCILWGASEF